MKLIEFKPEGRFVFVGDTHGDLYASEEVIREYLEPNTKICFLGDYVDRGPNSRGNINYLLKMKRENPYNIHLLQGNHERYDVCEFSPADFWKIQLNIDERKKYFNIFKRFPLVLSVGYIIALHGALPDINKIQEINSIKEGDSNWMDILWGYFQEDINFEDDGDWSYSSGIPQYDKTDFNSRMNNLNKKVLIRSHQSNANSIMFDNKCLTIFTSSAYGRERTIAVADFNKKKRIKSIDDLIIKKVD